ncbi:hypothetical protein [uncultured Tateyamaria sp.]|uniref:hypothetical protein n=1 Tax=uncultured Tateyamaria sp. TaxID=455651 RepID=UPI0026225586|nr:hypothetical protein [uncultured Tateyamaria sp.]
MQPRINRRSFLLVLGSTVAMVPGAVWSQSGNMHGALIFRGGKVIPEGKIEVYLEDPSIQDKEILSKVKTRVKSDGRSRKIAFSLALPASSIVSPTLQIVARLEREDGWLLARGSAQVEADLPVSITLNTAMY